MATNYADLGTAIQVGNDRTGVIVVNHFEDLRGGRTLDVTGFAPTVIPEGHVIIKETATGTYKPMPVAAAAPGSAYAALPGGHTYAGFNVANVLTSAPFASVLIRGTINDIASVYNISAIKAAVATALPLVTFKSDNE